LVFKELDETQNNSCILLTEVYISLIYCNWFNIYGDQESFLHGYLLQCPLMVQLEWCESSVAIWCNVPLMIQMEWCQLLMIPDNFAAMSNWWFNWNDLNHLWLFGAMSLWWFKWNDVNHWWSLINLHSIVANHCWLLLFFHVIKEQTGESLVNIEWNLNHIGIKWRLMELKRWVSM